MVSIVKINETLWYLMFNFAFSNQIKTMTKITVSKGDGIGPEIMDATQ